MATMVKPAEATELRTSSVISTQEWVDDVVLDLLFVLGRVLNRSGGGTDILWSHTRS